jgi:hypothetical protein
MSEVLLEAACPAQPPFVVGILLAGDAAELGDPGRGELI